MTAQDLIKKHEGLRLMPYRCTADTLTIGYGHNLDALGISQAIADALFEEDYVRACCEAARAVSNFARLSKARRAVLINMCFNMGGPCVRSFVNMRDAIETEDWPRAQAEMLTSKWAMQVPMRAHELAKMLLTGEWPVEKENA